MNADTIDTVTVLGLGTMGHGIAQSFAVGGLAVRCFDESAEACETLGDRIRANLVRFADADLIAADAIDSVMARLEICPSETAAVDGASFAIETVREDLQVKQELFARVERCVGDRCILASNTSSFPITQISAGLRHPERAVNTHWFNPPHICPLVEVVAGTHTDERTVDLAIALHERIGKMAVRVNVELPGFLINRIQVAMMREVLDLLDRGVASAEDIDRAVRGSMGMRLAALGPLEIWDFCGLDVAARCYAEIVPDVRSDDKLPDTLAKLVAQGHFGFKTGRGLFEHPPHDRAAELERRDRKYLQLLKLFRQSSES